MSSDRVESSSNPSNPSRRDVARMIGAGAIASLFGGAIASAQPATTSRPADAASAQGGGFYRTSVGDVKVTLLSDGGFMMDTAMLFGDVPADELAKAKRETFMPDGPYPGHLNALLVQEGTNTILVDTGYGVGSGPTTGRLRDNLVRAGVQPADVTHVLITHAHPDHVGGLLDAGGKLAFPNARVLVNEVEHAFFTADDVAMPNSKIPKEMVAGMAAAARKAFDGVKERLELIHPRQKIGGAIMTVEAYGHTPGHLALRFESGNDALLHVADAVHVRPLQFAHPDYQILFDADRAQAMKTRKALLDMAVADRIRIVGAHIAFPAIGFVEKRGDAYGWVPDVWRW